MTATFSCDFCDAVFREADRAAAHETACDLNPKCQTCATCKHWDYQDFDKSRAHWKPQGGPWESEDDIPTPTGCFVFNDQTFRTECLKWASKREH